MMRGAALKPTSDPNAEPYKFKARPVNQKIMQSVGDLGVPRVVRKAPTVPKEFALSSGTPRPESANKKADVPDEASRPGFSARPVNQKILQSAGDIGVPRVVRKAPTVPKEFALSSATPRPESARKKVDVPDELSRPVFSSFGAPSTKPKPVAVARVIRKQLPRVTAVPVQRTGVAKAVANATQMETSTTLSSAKEAQPALTENNAAVVVEPKAAPEPASAVADPAAAKTTSLCDSVQVDAAECVPNGKRRVWAQDALPAYLAADDAEEEESDDDFAPTKRSKAPTPAVEVEAAAIVAAVVETAATMAAIPGPPPSIVHPSMAAYCDAVEID